MTKSSKASDRKRRSVQSQYIDTNPHKASPRWRATVGLVLLVLVTLAAVVYALTV